METQILLFFLCVTMSPILTVRRHDIPYECKYASSIVDSVDFFQDCPRMCFCEISGHEVTMKCVNKGLTYIPSPPKINSSQSLKVLFLCNSLPNVTTYTLKNLTSVHMTYLSLMHNNISHLANDAFNKIRNLRSLDLSSNPLIGVRGLQNCFDALSPNIILTKINISSMEITDKNLTGDTFGRFSNVSKFDIIMKDNNLTKYPYWALEVVKGLTYIDLNNNEIATFSPPDNYSQEHLKEINFDNNYFPIFPNLCKSNASETYFPKLIKLKIRWNFMRVLPPDRYNCLTTLEDIRLNGNVMKQIYSNQFAGLKSLNNITLSYMDYNLRKIDNAPFNNSKIKNIYFRKNSLWFKRNYRNLRLFEGCSSLELLNLCDNPMGHMSDDDFEKLLAPVALSLRELILGGCGLPRFPRFISTLANLRKLVMYRNSISYIPEGIFDNMNSLISVRFAQNQLSIVSPKTFPGSFRERATVVDLAYNPFSCICDLRWFIKWMRDDRKLFVESFYNLRDAYKCTSPEYLNQRPLLDLYMSENECLLEQQEKITTLTVSCIIIVLLVVGSVLYRYRWHIRYLVYMARYNQRHEVDTGHYEYDAFVAFSNLDRPWVIGTLLPVLERGNKLKICVHDRDFVGGKLVIDNIVDGIEKSRKVIVVLSNAFAQSRWCQFEMNLVQHHALEHDDHLLVVVLLEEIDSSHMTKGLKALLQTTTYLMWDQEDFPRKTFFNRLRMLLQKPRSTSNNRRQSV